MAPHIDKRQEIDRNLLSLLQTIDQENGALLLTDEELPELETTDHFNNARELGLIRVDAGSEWSCGAVVFLTPEAHSTLGKPHPAQGWTDVVRALLGRRGGKLRQR